MNRSKIKELHQELEMTRRAIHLLENRSVFKNPMDTILATKKLKIQEAELEDAILEHSEASGVTYIQA